MYCHFSLFLSLFHVFTGTFQVELIAYNFSSSEENFVEDLQVLRKRTKMLTDRSHSGFVVECWNFAHCIAPNHADLLHFVDQNCQHSSHPITHACQWTWPSFFFLIPLKHYSNACCWERWKIHEWNFYRFSHIQSMLMPCLNESKQVLSVDVFFNILGCCNIVSHCRLSEWCKNKQKSPTNSISCRKAKKR